MAPVRAGDPDRSVELLWGPRDGETRQGLSRARIVRAAVAVADAEGFGNLSMRKVAERLGFTTMSLYRHVPSREHLVDLMCDAVMGEGPEPEVEGGWRTQLEASARHSWARCRRHPWLAEVRAARRVPGPNSVALYDRMLAILAPTGLRPSEVVAAVGLVGRFIDAEALVLLEAAEAERASGVDDAEWWGARDALYDRLEPYPALTALWEAGGFDEPEDPFEFGLARLLDGIELLIRSRDETRDETSVCQGCGAPVRQPASGRPRAYCSRACQQRAYRNRKST
jgi:AcrR family transcriptional regulator